ncbi:ethanolamine utilization acetate kinase EutQ [Silvimonas iriomotensis]|uniref:Ethanolamine utilization protein EutQ n=1 Tax=Silvimonas iriomotensis TaxID=449662 RepID=A0ABQ2PBB3_9NEIS|nr:ethanolamine utilization acetate kinase EutQ [Silvimonas iriomotensis]GGP22530.1 ethanolamine utilization protein EutQ [Silvimonas iriomotensis]
MKQLITAETVRNAHAAGRTQLEVTLPQDIVTPEARVVAERLGVTLTEAIAGHSAPAPVAAPASPAAPSTVPTDDADLAAIRAAVLAQLPAGSVPDEVVAQLVRKVAAEQSATVSAVDGVTTLPGGIKCVSGQSVRMGVFDGAPGGQIGIADVITSADGSSMAAGFMQWNNAFFPWTLNYDEVDMVLEGELHIRCAGQTVIGKAGDVMFIPKGSSIEFGSPGHVRFLYVAYPANWQEC